MIKKILIPILVLIATFANGQIQTNKAKTDSIINAQLAIPLKPAGVKVSALQLSKFANQADSIARTKESFLTPGSSSSYLNGLKQWIAAGSITGLSWSGITVGKPTTLSGYGITDGVTFAGAGTFTNKVINGSNNTITLTSANVTGGLGYTPVNPAGSPTIVSNSPSTQALGSTSNYWGLGYINRLQGNSTAAVDMTTAGQVNITGVLGGNGSGLTGLQTGIDTANIGFVNRARTVSGLWNFTTYPQIGGSNIVAINSTQTLINKTISGANNTITNIPSTGINNTSFVDNSTVQTGLGGNKTWIGSHTFTSGYGQIALGTTSQAGKINFNRGSDGSPQGSLGYSSATEASDLELKSLGGGGQVSVSTGTGTGFRLFSTGVSAFQNGGTFTNNLAGLQLNHSITASSGVARGMTVTPTLTAAANNDVMYGADFSPTFVPGVFTGVTSYAARFSAPILTQNISPAISATYNLGANGLTYANVFANAFQGGQFINSSGGAYYGSALSNGFSYFRQGNTSQIVGGYFGTTGNAFDQASGTVPSDNGFRRQIYGSLYTSGDISVGGNVTATGQYNTTQTATSAIINITPGTLKTTPVTGDVEANGDKLYYSVSGAARKDFVLAEPGTFGAQYQIPYSNGSGRVISSTNFTFANARGGVLWVGPQGAANFGVQPLNTVGGSWPAMVVNSAAHTQQTAGSEVVDFNITNQGALQYNGGTNMALQRVFNISPRTYAFTTATTITNVVGAYFAAPVAGTNATFTNTYAGYFAGGTYTAGAATITGTANTGNLSNAGNATIGGTVNVGSGKFTVSATGQTYAAGAITGDGGLYVNGGATVNASLTVSNNLQVNGASTVNSTGTFAGNVTAPMYLIGTDSVATKKNLTANQWTGKGIVWCGTSIPWNFAPNSYPELIGRMLGATMYNTSISGSKIIFNGSSAGMSGTYTENNPYGQNQSYQATIMYYLAAPFNAKLVVIDHTTNDISFLPGALGDITSTSKSTFYGAYNFLINEILTNYPDVKIVLATAPNRYPYGQTTDIAKWESAATAIKAVAYKWGLQTLDWGTTTGINTITAVAGKSTSDGLHPTATVSNGMATTGYKFILDIK